MPHHAPYDDLPALLAEQDRLVRRLALQVGVLHHALQSGLPFCGIRMIAGNAVKVLSAVAGAEHLPGEVVCQVLEPFGPNVAALLTEHIPIPDSPAALFGDQDPDQP